MRVVASFYLSYPDNCPVDPTFGATKMLVYLGEEGDTIEHFQGAYLFQVYTFRYVREEFIDQGKPVAARSLMLVPTLADDWMSEYLKANVDCLANWGEPE
jgi:hypothetical protein